MSKPSKPTLPKPVNHNNDPPFVMDESGPYLILNDIHLPYHDAKTIELSITQAKKERVRAVILNGDVLDSHEISRFDKDPRMPRYQEEIKMGKGFLRYIRHQLPKVRIVFKEGNHDNRLARFLINNAPALFGLPSLSLPSLLEFDNYGVEHVADRQINNLGKLHIVHGHEFFPPIQTPVNPARGLFVRAKSAVMEAHFHQTSEHHETTITGKPLGAWSVGCACQLNPRYNPFSKWNHGFAFVYVENSGEFSVRNLRIMNGKIV